MSPLSTLKNKSKLEDEKRTTDTHFRGDGGILKAQSLIFHHINLMYINTYVIEESDLLIENHQFVCVSH